MKSLSSLLLVAVVIATLGTTATKADPENTYRQYPERHHDHRSDGDKHGNRGNDSHKRYHYGRGYDSNSARGNDSHKRYHYGRGHDSDSTRGND